ncbi:hypothetical protein HDU87_008106 [Geranomyces variabilis]|uniref:Uncharacterized protein n=1 Tax=Geranomyces variabilis TaxID=109894 RepID=A0AAD5XQ64_9FUNG|nr:hypothetical protein HDU87_008106 [Geranomyces variabilis]
MAPRKAAAKNTRVKSDESSPHDPLTTTADSPPSSNEIPTTTTPCDVVQKPKAAPKPRKRKSTDESSGDPKPKKPRARPAKKDSATDNDVKTEQKTPAGSKSDGSKPTFSMPEIMTRIGSNAEAWIVDQFVKQNMAGQTMNVRKVYEDYIARFSLQYDEFHHAHKHSLRHKVNRAVAAMKAATPLAPAPDTKPAEPGVKAQVDHQDHDGDDENFDAAALDAMLADLVQGTEATPEVSCEA